MRGFASLGIGVVFFLSGCATATGMLYSEQRLADLTAPQFGLRPSEITISNREPTSNGTYYDVTLPGGRKVRCFHDGNLGGMGLMSNPPRCGDRLNNGPFD